MKPPRARPLGRPFRSRRPNASVFEAIGALIVEIGLVLAVTAVVIAIVHFSTPTQTRRAWNRPLSFWLMALRSHSRATRDSALTAIDYLEPTTPAMAAVLSPLLADPDGGIRARAAAHLIALGRVSEDCADAVESLMLRALADGGRATLRAQAALVLGKSRPDSVIVAALLRATSDPDPDVRAAAAFAVGDVAAQPTPHAQRVLLSASRDPDAEVRASAVESLRRIWPQQAWDEQVPFVP